MTETPEKEIETPPVPGEHGITIEDLTVVAGVGAKGRQLLDKACAVFPPDEISLIVGPSGVGKSIVLRIISGLIDREPGIDFTGRVTVNGRACRGGDVGVVFQSFALFDELSPLQNVRFAHSSTATPSETKPRELLQELRVPENVPTSRLSGGQRQRLAIARTLAFNPPAILYDEPTSGLDPSTGRKVADLIRNTHLKYGKTSVIVTHDYNSLLPIADRIYLLDPDRKQLVHVPDTEWEEIPQRLEEMSQTVARSEDQADGDPLAEWAKAKAVQFFSGTTDWVLMILNAFLALLPVWKNPKWGLRFLGHYARLVFGPTAWIYLITSGIISGFVVTYFTFKFLPYANYTEPLLIEDLLTALGFAMYRIFVPILACILIAARSGAAVTSDIGGRQYGHQIDALKTFDAQPRWYLLTPIMWSFLIGTPILNFVAYLAARTTSLVTFVASHPDRGPDFWHYHFHRGMSVLGENWYRGTDWLMAKLICCGFGVALISYYMGCKPKYSTTDVSRAVTSTILFSTLFVLIVHFVFAFYEYEGLVAGGR